jgi:hypothetical protein
VGAIGLEEKEEVIIPRPYIYENERLHAIFVEHHSHHQSSRTTEYLITSARVYFLLSKLQ